METLLVTAFREFTQLFTLKLLDPSRPFGISCAFTCIQVTILERQERVGGRIKTLHFQFDPAGLLGEGTVECALLFTFQSLPF